MIGGLPRIAIIWGGVHRRRRGSVVLPGVHRASGGGACPIHHDVPQGGVPGAPPSRRRMRSPPRRRRGEASVATRIIITNATIFLASLHVQVAHRGRAAPEPTRSDHPVIAATRRSGPATRRVDGRLGGVAPVIGGRVVISAVAAAAHARGVAIAVIRGVGVEPALLAAAAPSPRRGRRRRRRRGGGGGGPGRRRRPDAAGRGVIPPPAARRRRHGRCRPPPLQVIGERYFPGG